MATSPATERDLGTGTPPRERRRHPRARFSVRRPVSISLDRKSTAVVLDLSQSGVGIRSMGPIRRGSTCRLHFQLPDTRERIEAEALATWSDDSSRVGFQFTDMPEATRALLSAWVERRTYSGPSPFARPASTSSGKGTEIISLERQLADLEHEDALRLLVARSQSLAEAEGAAIALGAAEGFVCRATLGNAPDLGVTISPDSGLSGECLRTGVVVRCENTELDPRVDREVCRALNLRSVVVVPVVGESYRVAGLLEVFSSRPHAFSGRHVLLLRQLAELIAGVISGAASKDSALNPPPPPEPAHEQLEADDTPSAPATAEAPAVVPAAEASSPPPTSPSRVVCDVCGFENLPIDRDCQNCDVPLPTALDDPDSFTIEAPPPPEIREVIRPVRAAQPASHTLSGLLMWFLLGVALAVAAFAGIRWRYSEPAHAVQGSVELSPILNTAVEASGRQQAAPATVVPTVAAAATAPKPKPSPKQNREPELALREARLPNAPPSAPSAPDSLALVAGSKLDSPLVAVLSAPTAPPRWVIAASAPVPAKLMRKTEPAYPKAAVARHIEGTVVLHAIITNKGEVQSVTVVKGNELLAQAAVHAVKQWRYSPAQLDGQPVDADANITISFSLAR